MKKLLVPSSIMIVLSLAACSDNKTANIFNGTWEKTNVKAVGCRDTFTFKDNNKFEVQDSRLQGGKKYTGTYKNIEDNDYQFNYNEGTNVFKIEVTDTIMNVQMSGSDNVCKYNKVN